MTLVVPPPFLSADCPIVRPTSTVRANWPSTRVTGELTTCLLCSSVRSSCCEMVKTERLLLAARLKCPSTTWRQPAETGCPVPLRKGVKRVRPSARLMRDATRPGTAPGGGGGGPIGVAFGGGLPPPGGGPGRAVGGGGLGGCAPDAGRGAGVVAGGLGGDMVAARKIETAPATTLLPPWTMLRTPSAETAAPPAVTRRLPPKVSGAPATPAAIIPPPPTVSAPPPRICSTPAVSSPTP